MEKLSIKTFRKDFVDHFPGDNTGNLKPRQTPKVFYSKAVPTAVAKPELLAWSDDLAKELGIDKPEATDIDILGGNKVTPSMFPYAACYAGHQFGNWAGQLGDGRAITLGEWMAPDGQSWELQLKGAGPTPYSRRADGRAVLRSSVREYLMSEAMHYLGVPTTRALSLVTTGDPVLRDMFYDGRAAYEPGAIVMRVAPTFLRFGSFEMPAARGEIENLKKLVNWTIDRYYPHHQGEDRILKWFLEVVDRTARMIVEWLRVGFVHGVMNTDNMSILGLTIDYGPYSFVDDYDPAFTPNTTDLPGRRYAFGRQPTIAYWNLGCLANALSPLFEETEDLQAALDSFQDSYSGYFFSMMAGKLGLKSLASKDADFITQFDKMMAAVKPDMTIFYQLLIDLPMENLDEEKIVSHFDESFYSEPDAEQRSALNEAIAAYVKRVQADELPAVERQTKMHAANPRFILRNYLLHQAIEELEKGENTLFLQLMEAMKEPYSNQFDQFLVKRPDWASQKAGCSMLSCSS
jgi:uncharacterized protein YdiU (UPF0061 family)